MTRYSLHPSIAYIQTVIANMKEKTGRSIDEWVGLVRKAKMGTEKAQRDWLKNEHKLGMTTIQLILQEMQGVDDLCPKNYLRAAECWVEEMYQGKKAGLRPIYDAIIFEAVKLGGDVKICPCKTIVPIYRENVFAQVKPAAVTRVDLGLCLRGVKVSKRLIPTGGLEKGDRITHRIALASLEEFDADARKWLKVAYEGAS